MRVLVACHDGAKDRIAECLYTGVSDTDKQDAILSRVCPVYPVEPKRQQDREHALREIG
jgi:hypothetical protein